MNTQQIVGLLGGNLEVGKLLGVSPQAVTSWKRKGIPLHRLVILAVEIEKATDGKITRKDICPDVWESIWPELADKSE
jgi:DNA-binding transcriptional regulator YdaS (Cro superfamily)